MAYAESNETIKEKAETLNDLLKGVLVSSGGDLGIYELERDFKEMCGYDFPYREFNFSSFSEYLRSIPHVVMVRPNSLVSSVTSIKSAHVESLVKRQRKTPKQNSRLNRSKYVPNHYFHNPPSRNSTQFDINPYSSNKPPSQKNYFNYSQPYGRPNTNNHCISQQSPRKQDIHKESQNGHNTIPEPIREELKNILNNEPTGVSKLFLVNTFLMNDKFRLMLADCNISCINDLIENCSDIIYPFKNLYFSRKFQKPTGIKLIPAEEDDDSDTGSYDSNDDSAQNKAEIESYNPDARTEVYDDEDEINDIVIKNFKILLQENLDGIFCRDFPELYQEKFGLSLDFTEWGYNSVISMAFRLPKVFFPKREGRFSDYKLFPADHKVKNGHSSLSADSCHVIPNRILDEIEQLTLDHKYGIQSTEFFDKYQEKYKKMLDLKELKCVDFKHFLESIEPVIHQREFDGKLYLLPKFKGEEITLSSAPPALPSMDTILSILYPKEVCDMNAVIKLPKLDQKVPFIMQVRVVEAEHPGCFWMVMEHTLDMLEELMSELNEFYSKLQHDKYMMPTAALIKDHLCVAMYDGKWHRAKILHRFPMYDEVKVEYIDYGTAETIKLNDIRLMHKDFSRLPQFAIKGKLHGVKPVGFCWSKESSHYLMKHIEDKSILVEVIKCDVENAYVKVAVFQTNTARGKDFVLSRYLVDKKQCVYMTPEELEEDEENEIFYTKHPNYVKEEILREANKKLVHPSDSNEGNEEQCLISRLCPPPGFNLNDQSHEFSNLLATKHQNGFNFNKIPQEEDQTLLKKEQPLNLNSPNLTKIQQFSSSLNHSGVGPNTFKNNFYNPSYQEIPNPVSTPAFQENSKESCSHVLSRNNYIINNICSEMKIPTTVKNESTCELNQSNSFVNVSNLFSSPVHKDSSDDQEDISDNYYLRLLNRNNYMKTNTSNMVKSEDLKPKSPCNLEDLNQKSPYNSEILMPKSPCYSDLKLPISSYSEAMSNFNPRLINSEDLTWNKQDENNQKPLNSSSSLNNNDREITAPNKLPSRMLIMPGLINPIPYTNEVTFSLKELEINNQPKKLKNLKLVDVGTKKLHLMEIERKIMVSTKEIVEVFTLMPHHVVMKIFEVNKIDIQCIDIFRRQNQNLFKEIEKSDLNSIVYKPGVKFLRLNVMPLKKVPDFLSGISVNFPAAIENIKKVIEELEDEGYVLE